MVDAGARFVAEPAGCSDVSDSLESALQRLGSRESGVLVLPDGNWMISRPLRLPPTVSLHLSPAAVLRALPHFAGEALVIKTGETSEDPFAVHRPCGSIRGGTLDAAGHPITGLLIERACRLHIADVEIQDACRKGIHVGLRGHYEVNISNVRCSLGPNVRHQPGSIGLHYDKCTDSLINAVVIIGYETGVRSDSSSNDFHQIHVWNMPANGPLKCCFECNGWNDSYNQCYADSPFDGENTCYGFRVHRPFNRILAGRVYLNNFVPDAKAVGIHLEPGGTHGTYMANHFTAQDGHRMAAAFSGNLDSACVLGNSFNPNIIAGRVCQIPSGGGGLSAMPEFQVAGPSNR